MAEDTSLGTLLYTCQLCYFCTHVNFERLPEFHRWV
jgi:hypothetical protein